MFDPRFLQQIWAGVAMHLWQSTVVMMALLLPYLLLRNGPARLRNMLWSIALAKLFLPLPLLARLWEPLGTHIAPLLPSFLRGVLGAGMAEKATYILDPVGFGAAPGPALQSGNAVLFITLSAAWLLGAGWITYRWAREGRVPRPREGTPVGGAEARIRTCFLKALVNTAIPPEVVYIVPGSALPAVTGLVRRRIVLSEQIVRALTAEELEAILLHEREHWRRFDPLRELAKRIAFTVFFYYPPLWALMRQLSLSCEVACDQAVIRAGARPSAFARALACALTLGLSPAPTATALGLRKGSTLKNRLKQISQPRRLVTMRRHRFALLSAITLVVIATALPLPSCVKEGEPPPPEEPPEVADIPAPPAPGTAPDEDSIKPPALIQEAMVLPEYPEAERKAGIEGAVMLEARVLKDGSVGEITVIEGVEGHPALEESAVAALRQWRFEPATEDGEPVEMVVQIPLAFRLDDHEQTEETMPVLIQDSIVKPEYPEDARKAGITGKVILEAEVKPDGTPGEIKVKEGIPGYPSFDEMAIQAARQWRFKPGTKDGKPVAAKVVIPLEFSLDDDK